MDGVHVPHRPEAIDEEGAVRKNAKGGQNCNPKARRETSVILRDMNTQLGHFPYAHICSFQS